MINDNNLEIKFFDDYVVIRIVDNIRLPINVWRFDINNLSKNEEIFISNILSMSKSMTAGQDKKKNDERSN